jgi:DNA-binding NarL/FixJ family response regulator
VRVVILSAYDDIAFVDEALNTGVAGYLLKTASGHELAEAVRAAADGVFVLDRAISRRLARRPGSERPRPAIALTPREAEVLTLVARGLPNKRIAAELGLGVRTVEGYVSGVLGKLGAASRTEAALYALSHPGPGNDG